MTKPSWRASRTAIRRPPGGVVHRAERVVEAVGAADLLDRVGERLDLACDLARPVDVAGAVQNVDLDLPGLRQGRRLGDDRVDGRCGLVRKSGNEYERDECHQRRGDRGHADEASGGVDVERSRRHGQAGQPARLAPVDLERGRDQQRRLDRAVHRREAIDAPFLEPLNLVPRQAGALGDLFDRQPAVQARGRERAAVADDLGAARVRGGPAASAPTSVRRVPA